MLAICTSLNLPEYKLDELTINKEPYELYCYISIAIG
jgi:hypothetical protein